MTKTIKLLVSHPASPASRIQVDLNVTISQEEIDQLFTNKAIGIVRDSMKMQVNQILSSCDTYEQLEIDFEMNEPETSYQPYTGTTTFEPEYDEESEYEDEESEYEEDCDADFLTGRSYTPYTSSQPQPPQSFHERLPGTTYTPYRSFRNPIERS